MVRHDFLSYLYERTANYDSLIKFSALDDKLAFESKPAHHEDMCQLFYM